MVIAKQDKGFSLIELMVVLAILAIVVGISAPNFKDWGARANLKSDSRTLYANIIQAKLDAVNLGADVALVLDLANGQYHVCTSPGPDSNWNTMLDNITIRTTSLDPGEIKFGFGNAAADWQSNPLSQANSTVFDVLGGSPGGRVFIENQNQNICYAADISISGFVKIRKYSGILPFSIGQWS